MTFRPSLGRGRHRRGAAALELALLLPVLIVLFVAALDFCRVFHHDIMVYNCARHAANWESEPTSQLEAWHSSSTAAAHADFFDPVVPGATPSVIVADTTLAGGEPAKQVTVSWPFTTITPLPFLSSSFTSINVSRTVTFRVCPAAPPDATTP
jgi:Flp pilus assembly protein TadG